MADEPHSVEGFGTSLQWGSAASLTTALLALFAGLSLAWHHPLWPIAATAVFAVGVVVSAWGQGTWLVVLPAALPLLNFSPWTGWLIFDEFDLLILGALAGGFVRLSFEFAGPRTATSGRGTASPGPRGELLPMAFAGLCVCAFLRGLVDAGGWSFDWFDGYADASNSLRLSKSLAYAAALWPLLRAELCRSPSRTLQRFALGMQIGLTWVGLVLLWERTAYPGLLDFSARYRTTATFWEMHVGGAAIDAYLALATPFAAWALVSARSHRAWVAAATLALLTGHACLTTFSRGAYVGVALPLFLLATAWWLRRLHSQPRAAVLAAAASVAFAAGAAAFLTVAFLNLGYGGVGLALLALAGLVLALGWRAKALPWRRGAATLLSLALITEAVAVIVGGTFIRSRLEASESDFSARLAHWQHGLDLLKTRTDWLVGIGAGRLPSRYAGEGQHGEFSGSLAWVSVGPGRYAARLSGPATNSDLASLFSLTQRVPVQAGGTHQARLRLRTETAFHLAIDVCEQHLLYSRECQGALVAILPHGGAWQEISTSLVGPALDPGPWFAQRMGVFSLSVRDVGAAVEIGTASLVGPGRTELLVNRDFSATLAHWFPTAQSYYLPWHIDNLYLELVIERGIAGLVVFVLLSAWAFSNLLALAKSGVTIAPYLAASLLGVLLVGAVSSVLDVPRISFLLFLLIGVSIQPCIGHTPMRPLGNARTWRTPS